MVNFLSIIVYITLGYSLKKFGIVWENLHVFLNKFVIYISLPSLIFLHIPNLELSTKMLIPVSIAWIVMFSSSILVLLLSKYFHFSKEITGSLMLVAVLGNTSFVGIPIISAYLGDASLPYILMYDQLGTFLMLSTYGTVIVVYYGNGSESKFSIRNLLLKIITFPPFLSIIIALFILSHFTLWEMVNSVLNLLSLTIVPFSLVAVGLQLKFYLDVHEIKPFVSALAIKLVFAPIIAIIVCYIFDWNGFISQVSILEASMPPMITAAVLASMNNLAPRLSNALVAYGIMISFLTSWIFFKIIT